MINSSHWLRLHGVVTIDNWTSAQIFRSGNFLYPKLLSFSFCYDCDIYLAQVQAFRALCTWDLFSNYFVKKYVRKFDQTSQKA